MMMLRLGERCSKVEHVFFFISLMVLIGAEAPAIKGYFTPSNPMSVFFLEFFFLFFSQT
jgi:hypothetical protein